MKKLPTYEELLEYNTWVKQNSLQSNKPILTDEIKEWESVKELLDNITEIKKEVLLASNYLSDIGDTPYFYDFANINWDKFIIRWFDKPSEQAKKLFPLTLSIFDKHKDILNMLVSVLQPHSRIQPHRGASALNIRLLIPIDVPQSEKCFLNVNGTKLFYHKEKLIAFDDTYMHEVQNNTDKPRIVLHCDLKRKLKDVLD